MISRIFHRVLERVLPRQSPDRVIEDAKGYWSGSRSEADVRDMSHWRGQGRWDEERWKQVGIDHFRMVQQLCLLGEVPEDTIRNVVEWGPGGGANAVHFAPRVERFWGVDLSQPNLEECKRQVESVKGDFVSVLIDADNPESALDGIEVPADLFLSTAVFQHFPSKPYGLKVLELSHRILKPSGLMLVQIRYDNSSFRYLPKRRDYRRHFLTFTSYTLDEFWRACDKVGFEPLSIHLEPEFNYGYFFLKKPASVDHTV